jgi:hypothetical protein
MKLARSDKTVVTIESQFLVIAMSQIILLDIIPLSLLPRMLGGTTLRVTKLMIIVSRMRQRVLTISQVAKLRFLRCSIKRKLTDSKPIQMTYHNQSFLEKTVTLNYPSK